MRVAVVTGAFPALSQTFVLNQITGLIDRGCEVTILADPPRKAEKVHPDVERYGLMARTVYWTQLGQPAPDQALDGVRALVLSRKRRLLKGALQAVGSTRRHEARLSAALMVKAAHLSRLKPFDVVLCHFGNLGRECQILREMGALQGRLAVFFHGYDMSVFPRERGPGVYRELFKGADLLLPISEHWERELIAMGAPRHKIAVHRMGIDTTRFEFKARRPDEGGQVRLLTIGRLVEKKGVSYALEAFARVRERYPGARYHIAGDGPLSESLKARARELNLGDAVDFLGWKHQDEIIELLSDHHVLLTPSVRAANGDMEGLPVVLMEGLATGMPVISTHHSGIPELIRHEESGLLAEERDVEGLARALATLLDAPQDWEGYGQRGRAIVEEEFAIEGLNDRLVERLRELAGR
ncbi:colanic acid biosynthesis glycosyltransferase WcaL [Lujinxingia litoralis]|uniref:Colanic acid biosynthesis glycosyltransferase WcaL n=1 Tax=Lujinxingia litoralis TaxID=2211119 RepID=A0A328C6Z0_9DELT|nr:glycosyltransferase [Lujinxingia litoralis]RAL23715.1 colanic acid biosynthesis glycosyltransferase WcaL [Lujinxingia litoralis]